MYTWGYVKDAALAKLDLKEKEATAQDLLSRFPFYANEVMTRVCSAIKPDRTFYTVKVYDKQVAWKTLTEKTQLYIDEEFPIEEPKLNKKDENYNELVIFWNTWNSLFFTNEEIVMPNDFVSFGDDVSTIEIKDFDNNSHIYECTSDYLKYIGYNKIICTTPGTYRISYNRRWLTFTKDMDNNFLLDCPIDIIECIPSYIASQCYKIDDEYKSSVFRNEFETMLASIDDTNFKSEHKFVIDGDW